LRLSTLASAICLIQFAMPARAQSQTFTVHGTRRTCSDITQLDSVLTSGEGAYFAGWSERDYADALAWSEACKDYGWHIPGKPRVSLLKAQHDRALPPVAVTPLPATPAAVAAPALIRVPTPTPASVTLPPAAPAMPPLKSSSADASDPLLSDDYYNAHFHEESLWVAAQAHLDIGHDGPPSSWVNDGSAAQLKNRLTADRIVLFCAHRSSNGATDVRPLLWDWRHCEALEAAAYKRLVSDNEFPTAGRGVVLGCAGLDSYLILEHCIENLVAGQRR
jgi:hypothetical protein